MDLVVGLDVGTQGVKALVYCPSDGLVVGRGAASYGLSRPRPGAAEQDPADWLDGIASALKEALAGLDRSRIKAVAVSGQQHGLVALNSSNSLLLPCKLWCDVEAAPQALAFSTAVGCVVPPGFTAPKLLWLRDVEPHTYEEIAHVLLPHDFVNFTLTGEYSCEASDASGTGLFDAAARCFDAGRCAALDPRLLGESCDARGGGPGALLPRLLSPEEACGRVTAAAAARFGLPEGCLVAAGGGDNACAALGVGASLPPGCLAPSPLVCSLGTSGTLFCASRTPVDDPSGATAPFCDAAGAHLPLLCVQNCCGPAAEVRLAFGLSIEQAEAAFFASPAPDAAEEPLLMLPYLTGERTPNWPHASGALLGLRPGSLAQPGLIFRAALEGAAFALRAGHLRLLAAGVPEATQLLIVGGGAASPAWARVLAGAFRMPVVIAPEAEAAALGAAFCAGALAAGQGVAAFARERAPPPLGVPVLPLPEEAAYYERAFAAFVEAGEKLFGGR